MEFIRMITRTELRLFTFEHFGLPAGQYPGAGEYVYAEGRGSRAERHPSGRLVRLEAGCTVPEIRAAFGKHLPPQVDRPEVEAAQFSAVLQALQLPAAAGAPLKEVVRGCDALFRWMLWTKPQSLKDAPDTQASWERQLLGITAELLMVEMLFRDEKLQRVSVSDLAGLTEDEITATTAKARRPAAVQEALAALAADPSGAALKHCFPLHPRRVEWSRGILVPEPQNTLQTIPGSLTAANGCLFPDSLSLMDENERLAELQIRKQAIFESWGETLPDVVAAAPDAHLLEAVAVLCGWPTGPRSELPSTGRTALCLHWLHNAVTAGGGLEQWLLNHMADGAETLAAMGAVGATRMEGVLSALVQRAAAAGVNVREPAAWGLWFIREPYPPEEMEAPDAAAELPGLFRKWAMARMPAAKSEVCASPLIQLRQSEPAAASAAAAPPAEGRRDRASQGETETPSLPVIPLAARRGALFSPDHGPGIDPERAAARKSLRGKYDTLDELIAAAAPEEVLPQAALFGGYSCGVEWSALPAASRMAAALHELRACAPNGMDAWFDSFWLPHGSVVLETLRSIGADPVAEEILRLASLPDREGAVFDQHFIWAEFALDHPADFPAPDQLERLFAPLPELYRAWWSERDAGSAMVA